MKKNKANPLNFCFMIFGICLFVRLVEYFVLRTDGTIVAENFIHKVFGIVLLFVVLKIKKISWSEIGLKKSKFLIQISKGFLLGTICFAVAYSIEFLILFMMNKNCNLEFYANGFSLTNRMERQAGFIFVFLCVIFNIINVWMEEGIFRGLFQTILGEKLYIKKIIIIAILFGVWHWVMPLRDFFDGESSLTNLFVMGIGYIILAGLMSIKWSLLYKITGSLWMGMGDHFFNNVIVTNLLHAVSNGESDNLQIVRIAIGQILSFTFVLFLYFKNKKANKIVHP